MGEDLLDFDLITGAISAIGFLGILLLLPLYLSQRRDVKRLREWRERAPEHPKEDIAASEILLDRAERELEQLYAERGEPVTEIQPEPSTGLTSERPALERLTMELAALEPHARSRRVLARIGQPRWLAAIAIGALVLAIAAIGLSERLLGGDTVERGPGLQGLDPASIDVTILNSTDNAGLGGALAAEAESAGFTLLEVGATGDPRQKSVVFFRPGRKGLGVKVASELGIRKTQRFNDEVTALAGEADVVIVVGEDRAEG